MSKGIEHVANYLRKRPRLGWMALRVLPDVKRTIRIEPIGALTIRIRRHRSFWLRNPLSKEGLMFGTFRRLLPPGAVVYDVGSNIGMYIRFLVTCFGAAEVVGFEPMRENLELLKLNVARDPKVAAKARILEVALGDADGDELMQIDDVSSASAMLDRVSPGQASRSRRQFGLAAKTERVKVCRLDTLMKSQQLPPPRFIKVDVEGAAGMMLAGAVETLAEHRPDLIVETHGGDEARAAVEVLRSVKYACYGTVQRGEALRWSLLSPEDCRQDGEPWEPRFVIASFDPSRIEKPIEDDRTWI